MEYLHFTKQDEELIQIATSVIQRNHVPGKHHVGGAVRGKSGRVFTGVNLESSAISVCAEAIAIGTAASNGEREFHSIVAVTMGKAGQPRVLSPCGVCRELINFYGADISAIFVEGGTVKKCKARDLLPGPYVDSKETQEVV